MNGLEVWENRPGNIGLLHASITYDSIKAVQQTIQMQLSVKKVAGQCELWKSLMHKIMKKKFKPVSMQDLDLTTSQCLHHY